MHSWIVIGIEYVYFMYLFFRSSKQCEYCVCIWKEQLINISVGRSSCGHF
jgi:hypothetical protein